MSDAGAILEQLGDLGPLSPLNPEGLLEGGMNAPIEEPLPAAR